MTTGLVFKSSVARMGSVNMQAKPSQASTQTLETLKFGTSLVSVAKQPLIAAISVIKSPLIKVTTLAPSTIIPAFKDPYATSRPVDTRLQDKEPGPDVRYGPYEELTGISQIRPEILLLTNFQPLYDASSRAAAEKSGRKDLGTLGLNPVGEFLDAQIQLQNLRHEAMVKLVSDMKDADPAVKKLLLKKESDFKFYISNLTSNVNFLFETVRRLERLKSSIDIKNARCLTFENMVYRFFSTFQNASVKKLFDVTAMNNLTFQSVLADRGFDPKNVQSFTSSKTFLQTLFEINSLLKGNSYNLLGVSSQAQRADQDPVYINKHFPEGFVFSPDKIETITYTDLLKTTKSSALSYVNSIKAAYDALFSTTNFQSIESRMAFLSSWYSHEFSFSRSLASDTTKTFIRDTFGYSISESLSNTQLFDVALGDIGDKIVDRTDNYSANSISTIANKIVNNVSVLPFEPDYIEFEQSVHTPGSSYFVDSALQINDKGFNVSNMQAFSTDLDSTIKRFVDLSKHMNFIPTYKKVLGQSSGYLGDQFQNSKLLFEYALYSFVDRATGVAKSSVMASDLPGVFNSALKDNYLKSLLFVYVLLKSFAASSSSASQALETIVKEIDTRINGRLGTVPSLHVNTLTQVFKSYSAGSTANNNTPISTSTPRESISNELRELRSTSEFLTSVVNLFKGFYDAFISSNAVTDLGFTRFGHVQNVILMMIAFDLIVSVVSTYVPKQFVGQYSTKTSSAIGKTWYSVSTKPNDSTLSIGRQSGTDISTVILRNPVSINTVKAKLDSEVNSLVKMSFMIISSLASMKDTLDATAKVLVSTSTLQQLDTILKIVGDRKLLSLTMTQQQILLIKSMLDDINDKIKTDQTLEKGAGNIDFELRGPNRDDIALLDDSVITSGVKSVLLSLFANERFSSIKGRNIRLLTVGVPSGMAARLKQKVLLNKIDRDTFNQKQVDIIRVNVYKVDVEHQDLVFKPQSFLFELSRFVPRTGLGVKPISSGATIEEALDALPTRDYSLLSLEANRNDIRESRKSADYDFLTSAQKREVMKNHAMSYVLELYIKLLTGVSTAEYDLVVDTSQLPNVAASQQFIDAAADHVLSKAVDSSIRNKQLNSLENFQTSVATTPSAKSNVEAQAKATPAQSALRLAASVATNVASYAGVVETAKRARTVYADDTGESRRLFTPKLFDRVFSIPIDPDDYEIDITETLRTSSGKESFDKLLKQGMIEQAVDQSTFYASSLSSPRYKLRERDINENDLTFEKYFVTFDTVFDEVV